MVTSFIILSVIISNHLAHRAMEDVRAMKKIFCCNLLHPVLSNLSIHSKSDIVGHWRTLHHEGLLPNNSLFTWEVRALKRWLNA